MPSKQVIPSIQPELVRAPDSGLSIREILDRMDKLEERATKERGIQSEQNGARLAATADELDRRIDDMRSAISDRIGSLEALTNTRINDLIQEHASARKENRILMAMMIAGILALGGVNIVLRPDGSIQAQPTGSTQSVGSADAGSP